MFLLSENDFWQVKFRIVSFLWKKMSNRFDQLVQSVKFEVDDC